MPVIKTFADAGSETKVAALIEAMDQGETVNFDLSMYPPEDMDVDEVVSNIADMDELVRGEEWFSAEALTVFKSKPVLQAFFAAAPMFESMSWTSFPTKALNIAGLRSSYKNGVEVVAKLLGMTNVENSNVPMWVFTSLVAAISSELGSYKAMCENGLLVKIEGEVVTLVKGQAANWYQAQDLPVVIADAMYDTVAKDLTRIVGPIKDKLMVRHLAKTTNTAENRSRSSSQGRAPSTDRPMGENRNQGKGGNKGRGKDPTKGRTGNAAPDREMLKELATNLDIDTDMAKFSTWGEIALQNTELSKFRFVHLDVAADMPLDTFLDGLARAMGVDKHLIAFSDTDEATCALLKGLVMALPRYETLVVFSDTFPTEYTDMDDNMYKDLNTALFPFGIGFTSVDSFGESWVLFSTKAWDESMEAEEALDMISTKVKAESLASYKVFATYMYDTAWNWTRFVASDMPVYLGSATGLIQTTVVSGQVSVMAWNSTVSEYSRGGTVSIDMTNAQNMALPLMLMASSGDTNPHKGSQGQATYYDTNLLQVGFQTVRVRFLAIALPWTKAGGEGAGSTGGETLAIALPLGTYMAQIMHELTSAGTHVGGSGFETKAKYVVGNMSCATKGPYVFSGRDMADVAMSPAMLRALFRTNAETAFLVECEGVINPQFVHATGTTIVDRSFAMNKSTYRIKCTSMNVLMAVGSHEDLNTPVSQAGSGHRSSFRPMGGATNMGEAANARRGRRFA